jgi:hypothetical protein
MRRERGKEEEKEKEKERTYIEREYIAQKDKGR